MPEVTAQPWCLGLMIGNQSGSPDIGKTAQCCCRSLNGGRRTNDQQFAGRLVGDLAYRFSNRGT